MKMMTSRDVDQFNEVVGMVLKAARKDRNMAQTFIEEKTGLFRAQLYRVERGDREVSISELYRLSRVLNVDAGGLLGLMVKVYERKVREKASEDPIRRAKDEGTRQDPEGERGPAEE